MVGDGLGLADVVGVGLADFDGVGVADLVGVGLADFVGVGLADCAGFGLAEALFEGEADALPEASGVALAELLADALGVGFGVLLALADASADLLGVARATARTTLACPARAECAAAAFAGGWPQALAAELTALAAAGPPVKMPVTMPEETRAALAIAPSTNDPLRADLMAAPSSP